MAILQSRSTSFHIWCRRTQKSEASLHACTLWFYANLEVFLVWNNYIVKFILYFAEKQINYDLAGLNYQLIVFRRRLKITFH